MDIRFYNEYRAARRRGDTVREAVWWAQYMRALDYSIFAD